MITPERAGLTRALIANVVIHGLAMGAMALLLMPMMPGGTTADPLLRMQMIAEQPWRFRLGWTPWQLCAVVDLWLAVAMVRTPSLPRRPALVVLALTALAVLPDQLGQALWVTQGVALARQGDLAAYLAFERPAFNLTAGWGALLYCAAAILVIPATPAVSRVISTGNGIGFALMMLWLVGVTRASARAPAGSQPLG